MSKHRNFLLPIDGGFAFKMNFEKDNKTIIAEKKVIINAFFWLVLFANMIGSFPATAGGSLEANSGNKSLASVNERPDKAVRKVVSRNARNPKAHPSISPAQTQKPSQQPFQGSMYMYTYLDQSVEQLKENSTESPTASPTLSATLSNVSSVTFEAASSAAWKVEINAVADAYIRGGNYSHENFGNSTNLLLKASEGKNLGRKAILKFNLSDIFFPKCSYAAFLQVSVPTEATQNNSSFTTLKISRLVHSDWEENSVTWQNLDQDVDNSYESSFVSISSASKWVYANVSILVDASIVTFLLEISEISNASSTFSLSSKESDHTPKLIIYSLLASSVNSTNSSSKATYLSNEAISTYQDFNSANSTASSSGKVSSIQNSYSSGITTVSSTETPMDATRSKSTLNTPTIITVAVSGIVFIFGIFATHFYLNFKMHRPPRKQIGVRISNYTGLGIVGETLDDERTTGSDDASLVVGRIEHGPANWFKTLTAFQETGGSTLGGTLIL